MHSTKTYTVNWFLWFLSQTISLPFFYSCDQTQQKEIPGVPYNPEDYVKSYTTMVAQPAIDTVNPFLVATGKEKSWICFFHAHKIRFLYNHFRDSFVTPANFEWEIRNKATLNPMTIGTKQDKFFIQINHEDETESGDTSRVKLISITLNKKTYEGYVTEAQKK